MRSGGAEAQLGEGLFPLPQQRGWGRAGGTDPPCAKRGAFGALRLLLLLGTSCASRDGQRCCTSPGHVGTGGSGTSRRGRSWLISSQQCRGVCCTQGPPRVLTWPLTVRFVAKHPPACGTAAVSR